MYDSPSKQNNQIKVGIKRNFSVMEGMLNHNQSNLGYSASINDPIVDITTPQKFVDGEDGEKKYLAHTSKFDNEATPLFQQNALL